MSPIQFTKAGGGLWGVFFMAAILIFLVTMLIVGIRTGKFPAGRFGGGWYYRGEDPSRFRRHVVVLIVLIAWLFAMLLISLDQLLGLPVPNLGSFHF
jgi:hypothetical protein